MCDPQSTDWDAPLALTVTGTLAEGTQLLRDPADAGEECIYLSFEEDRGAGLFVHSNVFRGAAWEGSVLRIDLGTVALRLELERD